MNTWIDVAPMLKERESFQLLPLNGRLFAVGGYNSDGFLNSVECYDPFKNKWKLKAAMKRRRNCCTAIVHGHRLYVYGGYNDIAIYKSIECYNALTDKWSLVRIKSGEMHLYKKLLIITSGFQIETNATSLYGMSGASYDGFFIIAGGVNVNDKDEAAVIKIDFNGIVRGNLPSMNYSRKYFSLFELPPYNPSLIS